jgi:hypothetical protein
LVEHKLMIARTASVRGAEASKDQTRWWVRHDRFVEFCLLPAFTGGRNVRPSIVGIVITTAFPASVVVLMCART